ncbi:MAG: type II toxin-antitoxin system PemK/MazF family toxin [Solirubrobacteraceae bacterium]
MKRGEVWWSEHPIAGRRPVLVLTRDEAIERLSEVLIVPATRKVREIPTHVKLDESDGMPWPCALTLDTTGPLAKGLLIERIATLGPQRMNEVCRALARATDC